MRFIFACALAAATLACSPPSPQPQPDEMNVVNGTYVDQAAPDGALGNESINYGEGAITPAERNQNQQSSDSAESADQMVARYANLIVQRRFDEARQMWAPQAASFSAEQFEQEFGEFETMQAAIGRTANATGSGGSIEQVQLTLSGTRTDGSSYVITGPVTVQRAAGSSGSGSGQGQWQVVKTVLVGNAQTADALVEPQGGVPQAR